MLAKPRIHQPSVAMALVLLATASCQGNQARPNDGDAASPQAPTVSIELASFCAQAVPAYCDHLARCRPNQAMEPHADCLVRQGTTWCAELLSPKFLASVAAGRMRWNSFQASQCVQDMAAPACRTSKASTACSTRALFTGTVAAGGACTWILLAPSECRRGYCQTTTPCAGTCTSMLADGASCAYEADCAGGLYCIDPATGGTAAEVRLAPALLASVREMPARRPDPPAIPAVPAWQGFVPCFGSAPASRANTMKNAKATLPAGLPAQARRAAHAARAATLARTSRNARRG
jgi:hypothetical protein